jgi:putative flippase GtrA
MKPGRVARFGLVGLLNTAVYLVCYLRLRTEIPFLAAHVAAFGIAMTGSYFLNCYVTFQTSPTWRTFLLFPLSNLANLAATAVGLELAVGLLGFDPRVAPLAVAAVAIPITYVVAHRIMLGGRSSDPSRVRPPRFPARAGAEHGLGRG